MRRAVVLAAALAFALAACTCGDEQACSTCPPIEGTYAMTYDVGQSTNGCSLANWQPSTVAITRAGSTARTTIGGVELTGTVFDTFRFSLGGAGISDAGSTSLTLTGTFIPADKATDAGAQIRGNYQADQSGCTETWPYVGAKE